MARQFTEREITPHAAAHDRTGEYPEAIIQKAWKQGLMNVNIPREYGGAGLGEFDSCLISEELAAGCLGMATAIWINALTQTPLIHFGSEDQKERYLRPMTKEPLRCSYAVTEPGGGSDVQALRTKAERDGDEWVLNGEKAWITGAGVADWFIVLARTAPTSSSRAFTLYIVDADTPGIVVGEKEELLGLRASDTRTVTFTEVRVPEENMLGEVGEGFKIAMQVFDHTRPGVAAMATGVARTAMEHCVAYAAERKSMGRAISKHQGIGFMIADMARDIEAGRLLAWKAAWTIDQGVRNTRLASCAKAFATEMAMRVCTDAIQVFGAYGYSKEFPLEKLFRDIKITEIYEGTNQIQKLVIAKELFVR